MNQKKLALFYISTVMLQLVHVTFAQGGAGGGGGGGGNEPGTDGQGGQEVQNQLGDRNPNHWTDQKFIYRCAYGSTVTSVLPNFNKAQTSDDVMDLFVKQVKCSKVNNQVADIPVVCDWYPTICPDQTVYIRGLRKEVNESTPHFEYNCCVNKLACLGACQDKTATLQTDQRVFFYPEQQMDSNTPAPSISTIMLHDVSGTATMEWKYCENATICYTPPPGPTGPANAPPGSALGLLGLLGLLALLALGSPSSSSSSAPATTASG